MSLLWTKYSVRWDFITKLFASTPADPALIAAWLAARQPAVRPPGARTMEEIQSEVFDSLDRGEGEPDQTFSGLVFQRRPEDKALCMRMGTVRAHLKECSRTLSSLVLGRIEGEGAFSTRFVNAVYPNPRQYWIPILRQDGSLVYEADGTVDKPVHGFGPTGRINALKRLEYIEDARMDFTLQVLKPMQPKSKGRQVKAKDAEGKPIRNDDGSYKLVDAALVKPVVTVDEADLAHVMEYGGVHGYAGERSDDGGRYTFTITREEE